MAIFKVEAFDDVFDRTEEWANYFTYNDAAEFARWCAQYYPHVFVTCEHGRSAHCPYNCHGDNA